MIGDLYENSKDETYICHDFSEYSNFAHTHTHKIGGYNLIPSFTHKIQLCASMHTTYTLLMWNADTPLASERCMNSLVRLYWYPTQH